jgi:hypothetical protein
VPPGPARCRPSPPQRRSTTTGPASIPACRRSTTPAVPTRSSPSTRTSSASARAARTARSVSSSWLRGTPKRATNVSPVNSLSAPPCLVTVSRASASSRRRARSRSSGPRTSTSPANPSTPAARIVALRRSPRSEIAVGPSGAAAREPVPAVLPATASESATATTRASGGRSSRRRASNRSTSAPSAGGRSVRNRARGGGAASRTLRSTAASWSPRKGRSPASISYRTTPSDQRSVRPSSSSPRACSGLM